jgi:hypothetical protein
MCSLRVDVADLMHERVLLVPANLRARIRDLVHATRAHRIRSHDPTLLDAGRCEDVGPRIAEEIGPAAECVRSELRSED